MKKQYITMKELMRIIKPVKTCGFMDMCASFKKEIEAELSAGAEHYEISSHYTRNRQPYVIFNK